MGEGAAEGTVKTERCPEVWFGSEEQRALRERLLEAPERVLLLDYDGTLAPFHADKMQAVPYPGVVPILERLRTTAGVRLVLVTGRRASDLEQLIDVARHVEVWGSHGREHISATREYTLYPPTSEQIDALALMQRDAEASLAGVPLHVDAGALSIKSHTSADRVGTPEPLERKPASIAIHWRGLTAEAQVCLEESAEAAYRKHGIAAIERLPFASGIEFRAAGYTKAFAVERVLEQTRVESAVAYLGDDITDEDAFAAMNGRGISVLVRPELRSSGARYWIRPPGELLRFLEEWEALAAGD